VYYKLDITCPEVPKLLNAYHNTSSAIYNTVVKYSCYYGYKFPDGNFTKNIFCKEDGTWSDILNEDCEGKF
jgi:hypothetical protein